MNFIWISLALCIPTAAGLLFTAYFLKDEKALNFFDNLFLGFGIGMGILSFEMFILGLLNITYSLFIITSLQIILIFILLYLLYYQGKTVKTSMNCRFIKGEENQPHPHLNPLPEREETILLPPLQGEGWGGDGVNKGFSDKNLANWRTYLSIFLGLWIILKIVFVLYEGMNKPIYSWDAVVNWSSGAKLFYYEKGLILDPANENYFGKGYRPFLGHPLHSPMIQVWFSLWLGEFHEIYAKAWMPFYYISILGIFYLAVKREASSFPAIIATFCLSSVPLLTHHATDAYSDIILSYYGFAAIVIFWRYLKTENKKLLMLSSLFLGMGVFTKNEGMFFLIAVGIALLLFVILEKKSILITISIFIIPFVIAAGPWLVFKTWNNIGFGHSGSESHIAWFSTPDGGSYLKILEMILEGIFFAANFNLIFLFWLIMTLLNVKIVMRTNIKYLFSIILTIIAMFLSVYLVIEAESNTVTEMTGLNRNILTYIPIIFWTSTLIAIYAWTTANSHKNSP